MGHWGALGRPPSHRWSSELPAGHWEGRMEAQTWFKHQEEGNTASLFLGSVVPQGHFPRIPGVLVKGAHPGPTPEMLV